MAPPPELLLLPSNSERTLLNSYLPWSALMGILITGSLMRERLFAVIWFFCSRQAKVKILPWIELSWICRFSLWGSNSSSLTHINWNPTQISDQLKKTERERERERDCVCTILAADQQQPTQPNQPKANKNTNCEYSTFNCPHVLFCFWSLFFVCLGGIWIKKDRQNLDPKINPTHFCQTQTLLCQTLSFAKPFNCNNNTTNLSLLAVPIWIHRQAGLCDCSHYVVYDAPLSRPHYRSYGRVMMAWPPIGW